ncbi:MAG: RNA 2',3'-cyclic phosphodiesterase [Minisyncoccales bacterium]
MKNNRLFLAINLPERIKDKLMSLQKDLRKSFDDLEIEKFEGKKIIKWTNKDNLHITLAFIGNANEKEIGFICKNSEEVSKQFSPFSFPLYKTEYAPPNSKIPRMIWVKAKEKKTLSKIKEELDQKMDSSKNIPYTKDEHHFIPHVTLARIKKWAFRRLEPEDRPGILRNFSYSFGVNSIELLNSKLSKGSPNYSLVKSFKLK